MTIDWGVMLALIGSAAVFITAWSGRQHVKLEGDTSVGDMALKLAKELRVDVDRLKAENALLQSENVKLRADLDAMQERLEDKDRQIEELMNGVATLCTQLKQHNEVPWWNPKKKGEGGI